MQRCGTKPALGGEVVRFALVAAAMAAVMAFIPSTYLISVAAAPFDGVSTCGTYVEARMPSGSIWQGRLGWQHEGGYFVALVVAMFAAERKWWKAAIALGAGLAGLVLVDMLAISVMRGMVEGAASVWFNLHPWVLLAAAASVTTAWRLGGRLRLAAVPLVALVPFLPQVGVLSVLSIVWITGRLAGRMVGRPTPASR